MRGILARRDHDPDAKARDLKSRFSAVANRSFRSQKHNSMLRWARWPVAMFAGLLVFSVGLVSLSPWEPAITIRHLASFPNCDAARSMSLAPSRQGEPGYWSSHDRDRDGIACEPWPR